MSAVDHATVARAVPASGRLVAAAAFAMPPVILMAVALGLAFRGGGVAAEQWQPVAIGLAASLLVLAAVGAVPQLPRAALPTLASLVGLVAWSAASMAWTASREVTYEHVLRLLMLAAAALVGIAFAARPRAALTLAAAVAVFGAAAATAIEVKLLMGETDAFIGSRLSWPINYANADAALVWLPAPALVAFAAAQPLRPLARGLFGAFAALALAVGLASQSRGGAIALAGALVAAVVIARDRSRFALTLLAIALPVAAVAERMIGSEVASSADLVRDRGQATLLAAVAGGVLVCGLAMLDRRRLFPFSRSAAVMAFAAWTVALAVAAAGFVATSGRPDTWLSVRWDEFAHPTSSASRPTDATHFGSGTSNRYDYWRVAWRTFADEPLIGVGAGAFSVPWFQSRSIDENVTDPHSWQAGALAETGIVGLVLLGAALLLPLAFAWKARRAPGAWPIAAVALGGAAVFFILHASVDWLLRIPALAVPGFVVLGALATSGGRPGDPVFATRVQRGVLVTAAVAVLAVTVPAYLSTAAVGRAGTEAATSTDDALGELEQARKLNPFATEPLLVRSTILRVEGQPEAAVAAAHDATERAPENWAAWLVLGEARRSDGDAAGSRSALERAAILNPRALQLRARRR